MSVKARVLLTGLVLATVGACAGCGYATNSLIRKDIRTVYVEFFDNRTSRRGLEVPLTRAIVEEIKFRTPLLIAPRDKADSVLRGELLDVEEQTRVKSETDRVLLRRVTLRVRFRWRDRLTGMDIVPEQVVVESARVSPLLEDFPVAVAFDVTAQREETPFDLVLHETAQRIVEKMEKDW